MAQPSLTCWLAAGLLTLASLSAAAATVTPDSVDTADGARAFLLGRPQATTAPGPRPLVLLLHGHGGNAAQVLGQRRSAAPMAVWLRIADREGWLVAALDGLRGSDGQTGWNDCRRDGEGRPASDDVAFARAVVNKLVAAGEVDPRRVYAMGMSNGAMMVLRLAQELQPALAGFAAVSGLMAADSVCAPPTQAVPALLFMGTDDPIVPYGGGHVKAGRSARGGVLSAEQTAAAWQGFNQAPGPARRLTVPASEPDTRLERLAYGPEAGSAARVALVTVQGGGHVEPSRSERIGKLYQKLVGPQNHDVEAAELAWRFFSGWPLASPVKDGR